MVPVPRCCVCGCLVSLPEELYLAASKSPNINFYCAYGHGQHFSKIVKEVAVETPEPPEPEDQEGNVVVFRRDPT